MFPPSLVEVDIRLRLGLGEGLAQYQVEVYDPVTKELMAMRSRPPHTQHEAHAALQEVAAWALSALTELLNPDPFP